MAKFCEISSHSVRYGMYVYDISDPVLVDLTSNFFVLCTNVKVYIL